MLAIHIAFLNILCNGPSMEPTLYSNNILLTERITTRFYKPNRGDIIVAVSPVNPEQLICKRIVGVAGDYITLENHLKIDKSADSIDADTAKATETELAISKAANLLPYTTYGKDYIPKGYVWLEGDNRDNSADSRYYGPIPVGLIRSRVICRIWPLGDIRAF